MPGVDFACAFPAAQLGVLKRLRRLDLSGSRIGGKCALAGLIPDDTAEYYYGQPRWHLMI